MVMTDVIREIVNENSSQMYENMSAKELTQADAATIKKGIAAIDARMKNLDSVKSVMTTIAKSKGSSAKGKMVTPRKKVVTRAKKAKK